MKFDLDNLNPGVFFPFEDDDENGGVEIRVANAGSMEIINKETTKKKVEWRKNQRVEYDIVDEDKRSSMLWDYVIVGWKNINDSDGDPIECTTENKIKLMKESPQFSMFVGSCIETLSDEAETRSEELEKN